MRQLIHSLIPLFVSCFILLLGNGLINVLVPVSMNLQGIAPDTIGFVLSLYFVGLLIGALYSAKLVKRAGHIRMFAGCVALAALCILACSFSSSTLVFAMMRVLLGFCNACAFTAMESWLSGSSTSQTRGKVLAVYNAVVLAGLFGGQFFMNITMPSDPSLFVIAGMLFCGALIPIVLSRHPGPVVSDTQIMNLKTVFNRSPLGLICCLVSGIIYSALFNLLPVFSQTYGITQLSLSWYMGSAIFGAFVLQFPIGYLSDRFDRRRVLFAMLVVSALSDIAVVIFADNGFHIPMYIATAITAGIIACTYPLSISETFDKLEGHEMVSAMGCLILAFAIGGIIGPYSTSLMMAWFHNDMLFYVIAVIQLLLAAFVVIRMTARSALPIDEQEQFVMQGSVISNVSELDPRTPHHD